MTRTALLALCLLSPTTQACDTSHLRLSGTTTVESCFPQQASSDCVYAGKALYQYLEAVPDSDAVYAIGLQSSPWRMYDGQMRIISPEEVAHDVRTGLNDKVKHVELIGSWTGVAPAPGVESLAERVSKALDGFPVQGEDGFLWLAQDGTRRTTHQAFTLREGAGTYYVHQGGEVMAAMVAGWLAYLQDQLPPDDANAQMGAAVGWDVFFLCPDKALAGFEHAANLGSAIAAYNAAVMRLERGSDGDRESALALLERGATLGDAKSRVRLDVERQKK